MRAQEIFEKLQKANITKIPESFSQQNVILNVINLRSSLELVLDIPGFEAERALFLESIIFRTVRAQVQITPQEFQPLQGAAYLLTQKLSGLMQYLGAILKGQHESSIFVMLPQASSFSDVLSFEERFEKALAQILFHPKIQARIELRNWEKGSPFWLELYLGGIAAVSVIGAAAWAGAVIYKKVQEGRMHEEHVRSLKLKNEVLEALVEAEKRMLDEVVEGEARNIALKYFEGAETPEDLERVKYTIKEFAKLIESGAQIHPALQAPENVKNLFPDFANLLQIESKTKQISQAASPGEKAG
jgi:hypothetical protein